MNPWTSVALGLLLLGLVVRYFLLISVQGYSRMRRKVFRWPEDAVAFQGATSEGPEEPLVERAQAALRNDSESLPLFLALAFLDALLGLEAIPAFGLYLGYLGVRSAHAALLLFPRQPARTRLFSLGQLLLLVLAIDVLRRGISGL